MSNFSTSSEVFGILQPVSTRYRGVLYPGEAVIADSWDPTWGAPIDGSAMFRVVLLPHRQSVTDSDIHDPRIIVAVSEDNHTRELSKTLRTTATRLRDVAARYRVVRDRRLDALALRVEKRCGELDSRLNKITMEGLARARIVTLEQGFPPALDTETAFQSDDAETWLAALASVVLAKTAVSRSGAPASMSASRPDTMAAYSWLRSGADPEKRPAEVDAMGLGQTGSPTPRLLSELQQHGRIRGDRLRSLLVHELGLSPHAAFFNAVAAIMSEDGEIVWRAGVCDLPRLARDTLMDLAWQDRLVEEIEELRESVSTHWDSALPYIRLILPAAVPSGDNVPAQAADFVAALFTLRTRSIMASSLHDRVVETAGGTPMSEDAGAEALDIVLAANSWEEYFRRGRETFGDVPSMAEEMTRLNRRRRLGLVALEIEHAARYLQQAVAGLEEGAPRKVARALAARIDADILTENPSLWPSILADFQAWQSDYRGEQMAQHTARC